MSVNKSILFLYCYILLTISVIGQTWLEPRPNQTITPKQSYFYNTTNLFLRSFYLGGEDGFNGYFVWNGIIYRSPADFGITASGLTVVGVPMGSTIPVAHSNITRILIDKTTGLYVTNTATGEVKIHLGSYWHRLTLGDGKTYTPTGEQDLQIVMTSDPAVTNTTMLTNDISNPANPPWTLYIPRGGSSTSTPPPSYGTYTNTNTTVIAVGGVATGTVLYGKTEWQIFDQMLFPELWPVLTPPSSSFTMTPTDLYQEIGTTKTFTFTTSFDRGSIVPQYSSGSPYRSGVPQGYVYDHSNVPNQYKLQDISTSALSVTTNITYLIDIGTHNWRGGIVQYLSGTQPMGSKGTLYSTPLPPGATSGTWVSFTGVYPIFATTVVITQLTKQPLQAHDSTITTTFIEEDGVNKQTLQIPNAYWTPLTKVEQWNPLSQVWDTISSGLFTLTTNNININGSSISYRSYTWNDATIGTRQVRFTF